MRMLSSHRKLKPERVVPLFIETSIHLHVHVVPYSYNVIQNFAIHVVALLCHLPHQVYSHQHLLLPTSVQLLYGLSDLPNTMVFDSASKK